MRPLQLVNPINLVPGKTYLIQERRPEYAHQKFKGTFIKNDYPRSPVECTLTHFTNVICAGNKKRTDLTIPDTYWNYYEADEKVVLKESNSNLCILSFHLSFYSRSIYLCIFFQ